MICDKNSFTSLHGSQSQTRVEFKQKKLEYELLKLLQIILNLKYDQ